MYRLLDKFLTAQRTADARQEQPPTKRPSKGKPAGKSAVGTVEKPPSTRFGRPVTSAGQQNATPFAEWRFVRFGAIWNWQKILEKCAPKCTCQPGWLAVVSDLPIKRLTRATREGQSKLAAEQGNFADSFKPYQAAGGESSHRKSITRGKRRPHPVCRAYAKARPSDGSGAGWNTGEAPSDIATRQQGAKPNLGIVIIVTRDWTPQQFARSSWRHWDLRPQRVPRPNLDRRQAKRKFGARSALGGKAEEAQCNRLQSARKYTHDDRIDAAPV
jgi:hypothetical protein